MTLDFICTRLAVSVERHFFSWYDTETSFFALIVLSSPITIYSAQYINHYILYADIYRVITCNTWILNNCWSMLQRGIRYSFVTCEIKEPSYNVYKTSQIESTILIKHVYQYRNIFISECIFEKNEHVKETCKVNTYFHHITPL